MVAAGLLAAASSISRAQDYYLAGDFNAWCNNCNLMTSNAPSDYSYTITGQTADGYGQLKVTDGSWDNTWPSANFTVKYDSSGSATIHFRPGTVTPADGWSPLANRVGCDDPGNITLEVTGDFTNPQWGSDANAQMNLDASSTGVYTNIYIVATAGSYNFKFRTPGTWSDLNIGSDMGSGGNCVFTTTSPNEAVLFQLDLPNGRWQAGGPPIYCNVQFSVDMTYEAANNPGFDASSVTVNGDAIGWGGTACTNDPTAVNTNVFTSPYFSIAVGTSVQYQFRCLVDGITQYDAVGGISGVNRNFTVPNVGSTNVGPVFWNDASPSDYLNEDTYVTFSVDMTNAQQYPSGPAFALGSDQVYMNGDFSGWLDWNPISLSGYQLSQVGSSAVFTHSETFVKGRNRSLTYKYSINGADNEAGYAQNHFRYIRSTNGVYELPMDTFGVQYAEPKVGGLTIGSPAGGSLPISWLAYPNVNLQVSTNLTDWTDVPDTTAASSINWPMGNNNEFFRLIQPVP